MEYMTNMFIFFFRMMKQKDNEKLNPWDVNDLDIYLKYCCPECDSQHDTKDFFVQHALLEHPKAGEVLVYPEENWERKDEQFESDYLYEDLPSDNLELVEQEIKTEQQPKRQLKRKRAVIEWDDGYVEPDIKIEPRPKRNCSMKSAVMEVDEDDEEHNSDYDVSIKEEYCEPILKEPKTRYGKCVHCGKNVPNLKYHIEHEHDLDFQPEHKQEKEWKCTKCEKASFPKKQQLHIHRQECKSVQTCDTCGEICDGYDTLKKHFRKAHPKDKRYHSAKEQCQTCELCGKVLVNFSHLKKHLIQVHDVGELAPEKRKINCSICEKEFKSAVEMDEHFKTQCQVNDKTEFQNIEFNCKFCSTKWISHLSLELHIMEIHKKRMFSCDRCNLLVSYSKEIVSKHIDLVHKKLKNHVCHHCGKAYSDQKTLKKHLSKHHNEGPPVEKKYKCDQCDKSYELLQSLKTHIATNHQKSISYPCPMCSKPFLDKGYLRAHIRHVHKKYRPNKCDICPEAFLTKRDLKKHKEKHGIYD